ncbi:hypothetical protein OQX61_01310 [Pedobacter sp. PLR]|uniref:hypothetical protein n=1 Tax=Pedobacter sp. PLR TaxID=2994465 RepID=UPI0022457857|nr:hypothetical protein [Pedobacter sp. PLR]MCX2449895.1 hypothetical protein [Pedobacter sp. PLR]
MRTSNYNKTFKTVKPAYQAVALTGFLLSGLTGFAQSEATGVKNTAAHASISSTEGRNGLADLSTRTIQQIEKGVEKIHIGLVYPLSSNGKHAPLDTNNLSIHLLAGVSSVEKGFTFAGFSNIVRNEATGTQIAMFSNHISKKATGLQIAGFLNTYEEGDGAAFAGFANIAKGNIKGVQFAGFSNIAKDVKGAQFAGFLNKANSVKGSQLAGFINIARKNVSASQLSGFINKAEDVKGSQFAGFINIAQKVKGIQGAGFINIADSSDYPIGIINLVKKGEKSLSLTMDETQTSMLSFRSGGKVTYGIIGIGYNFKNKKEVYAMEAGLGAHWFQSSSFRLNTELTATVLENFKAGEYFKSSLRILPALSIGNHLELFGGPSLNFLSTNTTEGKDLHQKFIHTWGDRANDFQALYLGYSGGIQFIF